MITQQNKITSAEAHAPSVSTPFFQPKLTINQPNDVYEQEADAMAEKVMRMPDNGVQKQTFFKPVISSFQRKCAHCQQEEKELQRKERDNNSATASAQTEGYVNSLSGGKPLSKNERSFFEPRMNHDFSSVRLHTDSVAAQSAQSINALAYTVGNNIVFNSGQYSTGTDNGKKLLGHELTHVIQQRSTLQPAIQRFEGYEHQYFGDKGLQDLHAYLIEGEGRIWASQNGYNVDQLIASIENDRFYQGGRINLAHTSITPGEAISLSGDLYSSWQDLQNAPAGQLRGTKNEDGTRQPEGILDIMDREANHTISSAGATTAYSSLTSGNYLELAKKNTTHFSPANSKEWQRLHTIAKQTVREHPGNATKMNEALLIDAASGHFITDAFAAGHLINREETLAQIHVYLAVHPLQTANPEMQTFVAIAATQGAIDQLVLKAIHDHFNSEGLIVSNDKGMHWKTFGDNSLRNAIETQHIGSLAVFLSRLQVINAAAGGTQHGDEEVLDLLPNLASLDSANEQAIAYLPIAVQGVEGLMMGNRQAAEAALGPFLGPVARFYMNGIDARERARSSYSIPSAIQPSESLLIPGLNIGMDFNPLVTHEGQERNLSLGFFLGANPPKEEQGWGFQGGVYVGGSF